MEFAYSGKMDMNVFLFSGKLFTAIRQLLEPPYDTCSAHVLGAARVIRRVSAAGGAQGWRV